MSEDKQLPLIDYGKLRLSLKRLEEQFANYRNAEIRRFRLDREAVAESVIRRFRACYDCLWKVLRRYLIDRIALADVPNSPKPIFRLANQNSLFRSPIDQWLMYAQKRIDINHDHDGGKANACLDVVADFIDDAVDLYDTMSGETGQGDPAPKPGLDAAMVGNSSPVGS